MPSRPTNLISSFATSNENPKDYIECILINQDGTQCRKRCFNEKRYRSMQEHIRRAHSEHYIPKLPATEESVLQMMRSTAHDPMPAHDTSPPQHLSGWAGHLDGVADGWTDGVEGHGQDNSSYAPNSMFAPNHFRRGSMLQATNAASALAQLHNSVPENDWHGQQQDAYGDPEHEQDYMHNYFANDGGQDMYGDYKQPPEMSSSHMIHPALEQSLSGRATSTQPFSRRPNRPRKSSVTENARKGKHERDRSKDLKRFSHDRKALSAEPHNKRWEDLLDAAQSATEEEVSRDLTPIPQSPRSSMPPFQGPGQSQNQFQSYTASPLQNTLLPQDSTDDTSTSFHPPGLEAFPSVESSYDPGSAGQPYQSHEHQSSGDSAHSVQGMYPPFAAHRNHASSSGSTFHIPPDGLPSSSPGHHSRPQTHDSNHTNNAFARPTSSTNNTTHYPHPINAHHFAQHQAAAQQAATNYGQPNPPGAYSLHHASFSASASGASSAQSSANPHSMAGPQDFSSLPVQHFCAVCGGAASLQTSYACVECICGVCSSCAEAWKEQSEQNRGTECPKCKGVGTRLKPFQLDLK